MSAQNFRIEGRRVLVVGGATGMGGAAAQTALELGAHVIVMDVVPVEYDASQVISVDLSALESVEAGLAQVEGPLHAVYSCAGVADGHPALMKINFISQRHIIDTLVGDGRLGQGGAVAMISSVGGVAWLPHVETTLEFLATSHWEAMAAWVDAHEGTNSYTFSKEAINTYVAQRALAFAQQGLRINAVMPGQTDTPLARKHADTWLPFAQEYRDATGVERLTPDQMGDAVVFLCMDAASGVNGATLIADQGYLASGWARTLDSPVLNMILGQ